MALAELSVSRVDADESSDYLTFIVTLSEALDEDVTVDFRAVEGTAIESDFLSNSTRFRTGTLTIEAGETTGIIRFSISDDSADEVDESIWLELFNAKNAVLAGGEPVLRALGIVRDDDQAGSNLSLFVSSPTILEGDSGTKKAVFEVHLSQPYESDVTFTYTTVDGSAKAGSDYTAKSGSITFLAGQTVASVEVNVKGDGTIEPSEFFSLVVTPTSVIKNGSAGATGIATILADDADSAAVPTISVTRADSQESSDYLTFVVTLSEALDEDVTVDFRAVEGTAIESDFLSNSTRFRSGTLTIEAGETTGLIHFSISDDSADEVDESIWLELFNPKNAELAGGEPILRSLGVVRDEDETGSNLALFVSSPTILEGDSGTKKAVFEVHLSEPYSSDVTFTYTTVDGSAKAGSDYTAKSGSITFLAGQTVASVEVDIKGDGAIEPSEFFSLVVTPTSVIKNGSAGATGIATILADDADSAAVPTISVTRADSLESSDYLTFEITLSEALDEDVTVDFRAVEGTAIESDFLSNSTRFRSGTATIEAGKTTGLIHFSISDDSADEVDESIWLELFNPESAVLAGGESVLRVLGVVRDDDQTGSNLSLFVSSPTIQESNATKKAVFEVHLSQPYSSNVTFTYKTVDGSAKAGSDYTARSGSITFLAGQTVASIEVDITGDINVEPSEFFSLVVTPTGAIKNSTVAHTGRATIENDDTIHQTIYGTDDDDTLYGYDGNDILYGYNGHDLLVGGTGGDKLYGGNGIDTASYAGATKGVSASLSKPATNTNDAAGDTYSLIEKLLGSSYADTLTGNSLVNTLNGGAGNDLLNGGGGADQLVGGTGTDTATYAGATKGVTANLKYLSANTNDAKGDTYYSIENLTGSSYADTLTGGDGNNRVSGGSGDDKLYGGLGKDTLLGGAGKDIFVFDTKLGSTNVDTIDDFNVKDDTIRLDDDIFTKIGKVGGLASSAFYIGTKAHDANDRIIYDKTTGKLWYDADGSGKGAAIQFALLDKSLAMTASDFDVIG